MPQLTEPNRKQANTSAYRVKWPSTSFSAVSTRHLSIRSVSETREKQLRETDHATLKDVFVWARVRATFIRVQQMVMSETTTIKNKNRKFSSIISSPSVSRCGAVSLIRYIDFQINLILNQSSNKIFFQLCIHSWLVATGLEYEVDI
jgi:hypothetical protein